MAIFTNQATLSYRNSVVNSNVVSGEIVDTLSITKDSILPTYDFDGDVIYVVNVVNSGNTLFSGLTLTDDLGAYTYGTRTLVPLTYVDGSVNYFINGVLQASPTVSGTSPLVLGGISVPAGGVATIVYKANVNAFAPLGEGGSVVNTATLTGTGLAQPISDSETVNAAEAPRLDITKAINPTTVGVNGQLTYTFTLYNYGNTATVPADNVTVSDTFDPILTGISVFYNGVEWTAGVDYTYNETTGEFTTLPGAVTVPAATYTQDVTTGEWNVVPGQVTIRVTGTVS